MIINFQFWQHFLLEEKVLKADKFTVTIYDADFGQLE